MDSTTFRDLEWLAAPGPRRIAARTAGICGAALAAQLPAILLVGWPMIPGDIARMVGNLVVDYGCVALVVALTLHAVERAGRWPARWRHTLLVAGLVAAVATQLKPGTAVEFVDPGFAARIQATGLNPEQHAVGLSQLWFSVILASVSAIYLLQRQGSIEAEQGRERLEAQWQLARRRMRILRDATGAARLDPQVLFDCLGHARSEYLRDAPGADALLDRLIDFLRSTLSATRAGPHTLGLELALAVRFAAIVSRAAGMPIADAVPPALHRTAVSPGLLLPLVQHWLTACGPAATAGQPLTIGAELLGVDRRVLCLHLAGPVVATETLLTETRVRLADLYGGQASVRSAVREPTGEADALPHLEIRIRLPLETAHDP
jgi:hypothetical protein